MKDVPDTFPEPPDAQSPDDGQRQCGLEGSLPHDPEADEELHERKDAVGEHRIVIDIRGVPGDRVLDPAGVARGHVVEHAAEPVRSPGEHERLELQHRIEEPDRCQDQLKRPLEVPRLPQRELVATLRESSLQGRCTGWSVTSVMLIVHHPDVGPSLLRPVVTTTTRSIAATHFWLGSGWSRESADPVRPASSDTETPRQARSGTPSSGVSSPRSGPPASQAVAEATTAVSHWSVLPEVCARTTCVPEPRISHGSSRPRTGARKTSTGVLGACSDHARN